MKKIVSLIFIIAVIVFGYWTIAPLFIDKTVDDALPESAIQTFDSEEELQSIIATMTDVEMDEAMPDMQTESLLPIVDTPGHRATGNVRVIDTGSQTIIRYEDYVGTNGPDLFVYLANDLEANDFVDLGRARGNVGNINYTVPEGTNIADYKYVMTWCRAFGVLFDYAEIK